MLRPASTLSFRLAFLLAALLAGGGLAAPRRCGAQEAKDGWILLEEAKALIADRDNQDMGEALRLLRQAIEGRKSFFPEAEIAIADIYFREGSLELAATQLDRVLQQENLELLKVPEDQYAVLYRLAEIHEIRKRYADMQKTLERILEKHDAYASPESQRFRTAFLNAYLSRGLDQTLRLYRLEKAGFALAAHDKLGRFAYWNARYEPASILHLLFALDIMVTEAVQELRRVSPDFEFTTLEEFLRSAQKRDNVREYLAAGGFFRAAYYLAAATFASGRAAGAKRIWAVLAGGPWDPDLAGPYADRSRRQLREPRVETRIDLQTRQVEFPPD